MHEKRKQARLVTQGLSALITISQVHPEQELVLKGVVVDMHHTGIKIKLTDAIPPIHASSKVNILVSTLDQKLSMTIKGHIRHQSRDLEFGLQFADEISTELLDPLLFECVRSVKSA
jgi:hypothetical protein